jgi:hypothetical protein
MTVIGSRLIAKDLTTSTTRDEGRMSTGSGPAVLAVGVEVVQGSPLPRGPKTLTDLIHNFFYPVKDFCGNPTFGIQFVTSHQLSPLVLHDSRCENI